MNHNIGLTPASPTTYDHHVTNEPQHIKENQNGETSDAEQYDRQKHDYKPNIQYKKSDDNNKEKKQSKQENLPKGKNNKHI